MLALFVQHLLAFDFGWIAALAISNLLWIFIFICLACVLFGQKRVISGFFILLFGIWASFDFAGIGDLGNVDPLFIMISMCGFIVVSVMVETSPRMSRHFFFINSAAFIFLLVIYGFFMR